MRQTGETNAAAVRQSAVRQAAVRRTALDRTAADLVVWNPPDGPH